MIETSLVPAGAFTMGDAAGRADEQPPHDVYVDAFRIGITAVTNETYRRFLDATQHPPPPFWSEARFNAHDQPAVGVSWHDAVAFCEWLSAATGDRWRLPTEAEREKAARGGLVARYPWGDDSGAPGEGLAQDATQAVGLSAPNGYGLYDMAWNVHEWCSDWYAAGYYAAGYDGASPRENPRGPETGTRRASRGGAWRHQIKISRCAARSSLDPSFHYNDYGFRVVLAVDVDPNS